MTHGKRLGSLAVCILTAGCGADLGSTALNIPLSPSIGHVRTPEFVTSNDYRYQIFIGVPAIQTDEATCLAVRPVEFNGKKLEYPNRPCRALTPPVGAIDWVVTAGGSQVARGSSPAFPWEWPRDYEIAMAWIGIGAFRATPGIRYVVDFDIHPSQFPLEQVHPRIKIESPWSGP